MAIQLVKAEKGQKINLSKAADADGKKLGKILIGAGWDEQAGVGSFDADLSVAFVGADGKCKGLDRFLYYGTDKTDGKLQLGNFATHSGDNLTGEGDGDDEVVNVDLANVPEDVAKIEVFVTIHEASSRNQNFGMVSNAFVRIENAETKEEMTRFDLDFDASTETAIKFCTLHLRNGEWVFAADNVGVAGELEGITSQLGL